MPTDDRQYLPAAGVDVSRSSTWAWYCNIAMELRAGFLSDAECQYFAAYYRDAGLLRPRRSAFFRRHYADSFAESARFLLAGKPRPHVLDLGCGTGTQSLLLAMLGARVTALDMDEAALQVLRSRRRHYEDAAQRSLDVQAYNANVFEFDFARVARLDGVYSMFAFNMMQPSETLLRRLLPHLDTAARFAVIDGNSRSWYARAVRSRRRKALSPADLRTLLERLGFAIHLHRGAIALPPLAWSLVPKSLLNPVDQLLTHTWALSTSHLLHACRERTDAIVAVG